MTEPLDTEPLSPTAEGALSYVALDRSALLLLQGADHLVDLQQCGLQATTGQIPQLW